MAAIEVHPDRRLRPAILPGAPGLAVFETWVSAAIQQVHFITDFRACPQASLPRPVRAKEASFRRKDPRLENRETRGTRHELERTVATVYEYHAERDGPASFGFS